MNKQTHYKTLVDRYVSKQASEEELAVFFKLVGEGKLDDYLGDAFDDVPRIRSKRSPRLRMLAVAALVLAAVSLVTFFMIKKSIGVSNQEVVSATAPLLRNISTARGQQQEITLSDGTHILLSAASNIRYPDSFIGDKRVIELDGEGYFDVAHNYAAPFLVKLKNNVTIEVTGTSFVISSYQDEKMKATLFEGIIKVQTQKDSATLHPGQEVSVQAAGALEVKKADLDKALALKNGILQFDGADVPSVMLQLEKWFDVKIKYEGKIPARQLTGKIPINTNIKDVIKILDLSNVRCRIDGENIIVLEK
jgi:transmembrane sensor